MLMNAFDKPVQSNTEQAGRGHGFARMFDRVCAFLDERVGGASALIAACQSVADRFWHSKLYFPVCFLMLAVFMAAGLPVVGGVLVMSTLIFLLLFCDDLDQQDLPDIVSQRLTDLDRRLSQLEKAAQGDIPPTAAQIAARQRK